MKSQHKKKNAGEVPLPSRWGVVISVDWLLGLPMTASGFDRVQVHVDTLSGKVSAVPTRATDAAAGAARIVREMALRSRAGDGVPDVLVVDHDHGALFRQLQGVHAAHPLELLIGSAYHKSTNAKAERVNGVTGVLGDTLRAFANGRTDEWDVWLALQHAAQRERKAALDRGRVDTTFQVGDQVMLRT